MTKIHEENLDGIYAKQEKNQDNRLDFLNHSPGPDDHTGFTKPTRKNKGVGKTLVVLFFILLISGAMYLSELFFSSPKNALSSLNRFNPIKKLAGLIMPTNQQIEGEENDRINILLLGIGGEGHDGPYLTDTIILASLKPSTLEASFITLPRDMIVDIGGGRWRKINSIYSSGKTSSADNGAELISQAIENTTGQPVHYHFIVDFDGFKSFIDKIGGIKVNVENSFTDYQYPTEDYKVKTVSFQSGLQTMDGDRALVYARSRHGNNGEGSDFARSKRQQLILQAVRDKVLTFSTLLSPHRISSLYDLLKNHIETNLVPWEMLKIGQLAKQVDDAHIYRLSLDDGPGNLLVSAVTPEAGYILRPRDGNYEKLKYLAENIFNSGAVKDEAPKIDLRNGTSYNGLAFQTSLYLKELGYGIINQGNADSQDYQRTTIYDLTGGKKPKSLESLKTSLRATTISEVPSNLLTEYNYDNDEAVVNENGKNLAPDFLVILGIDYALRFQAENNLFNISTSSPSTSSSTVQ